MYFPWWLGGMAVAATMLADDYDAEHPPKQTTAPPTPDHSDDNGNAYERDLQRLEGEGGPPAPDS